jgi:beta-phosphoglucomutase-like phosphatase (HAD superfamily)
MFLSVVTGLDLSNHKLRPNNMIINAEQVKKNILGHTGEYAAVHNPSYVFPPIEYYPLAPPLKHVNEFNVALMDMDGTTTTTEVLCIHSLEMMLRKMSGKMNRDEWQGVDHNQDLQHIIGNSTTKHVEYLLVKYKDIIREAQAFESFVHAAAETLLHGQDENRKDEVIQNIRKLGLSSMLNDIHSGTSVDDLIKKYGKRAGKIEFSMLVNVGIDIYYATYHRILGQLKAGKSDEVKQEVSGFGGLTGKLIAPMPGIPLMIPLIKGWLGDEAAHFGEQLITDYEQKTGKSVSIEHKPLIIKKIAALGKSFEQSPAKVGLVTSSIAYEADIVIREVLKDMADTIEKSPLSSKRKQLILHAYEDYHRVYDAFVTASDSSEIRLKPHRDLYSIALHRAGISPVDFDKVIGFEDSQSGTVAIRAAGIGCCIAVPFAQTTSHNLEAATHILPGGIPEAIIDHGLFIRSFV